jgi:Predicted phosphohydrolases
LRTLCISDIHGCFDQFEQLLKVAKYNPDKDKLVLLGDYVDRGMKSKQVLAKAMQLHKEYGVIVLKGNHDDMFVKAIRDKEDQLWLYNGGIHTVTSYYGSEELQDGFDWDTYDRAKKFIISNYNHHVNFLEKLPLYHEDDDHIFVHAGINPFYGEEWKEKQSEEDFIWIRDIFYRNETQVNKTVVFGHTPTRNLHNSYDIWFDERRDKIGLDGACAYGGQLNCLEISNEGYKNYSVSNRGDKN